MTHPLDLLDALDNFMVDGIRYYIVANNDTVSDEFRDGYWAVVQQIEAWRNLIQPPAIYPEPAPVENCRHPYDRDYAFVYTDIEDGKDRLVRCCCVCGYVGEPRKLPSFDTRPKSKRKKKETTP